MFFSCVFITVNSLWTIILQSATHVRDLENKLATNLRGKASNIRVPIADPEAALLGWLSAWPSSTGLFVVSIGECYCFPIISNFFNSSLIPVATQTTKLSKFSDLKFTSC